MSLQGVNAVVDPSESTMRFTNGTEIVIGHISDLGYYPLSYCYASDFAGTTYRTELLTGTTIFMESSVIIKAALDQIAQFNPNYLVVTGNLTRNGEALAHIEVSNLLRKLQNAVRINKPNFQIFVIPGSNDIYNKRASRYDKNGEAEFVTSITRKEFAGLYAGLGYPKLSNVELLKLYNSIDGINIPENAFELEEYSWITNSNNSGRITFKYQFQSKIDATDYDEGELTYVARTSEGRIFFCADDFLNDGGGRLDPASKALLDSVIELEQTTEKKIFGVFHHNVMEHLGESEIDSLISGSVLYNSKDTLEYLANIDMRYVFSGHAGVNDINSYISFNGKMLIEATTTNITGYKGGVRYVTIESGMVQNKYAENYYSDIRLIGEVEFTQLIEDGYISMAAGSEYINIGGVENYIRVNINNDGRLIYSCSDVSEFAATKIFRNMLSSYVYTYINSDMLNDLYKWIDNIFKGANLEALSPYAKLFTENIIDYLEDVVLIDYSSVSEKTKRAEKLAVYFTALINDILSIRINPNERTTLAAFLMDSYLNYIGGVDSNEENASENLLKSIEIIEEGTVLKTFMEYLLYGKRRDENTGMLRIINGLMTTPLNLAKGMETSEIHDIETTLSAFAGTDVQMDSIYLESLVAIVIKFAGAEINDLFDIRTKSLSAYISYAINTYFADSVYMGLSELLIDTIKTLNFDETPDGGFNEKQLYRISGKVTYIGEIFEVDATMANGRLPSMLTITFGADATSTKNFVWFTDKNITDSVVKYKETNSNQDTEYEIANGSTSIKGVYAPSVSLGIVATYSETELARHTVSLTNLKPGTSYTYMAGSSIHGFWVEGSFKTDAGNNAPFNALLISDIAGFSSKMFTDVSQIIGNIKNVFDGGYDFVVNAGNSTNDGRNINEYEYFLDGMSDIWRNTTMAPAAGSNEQYNYVHSIDGVKEQWSVSDLADVSSYNTMQLHYQIETNNNQNQLQGRGVYYSFDYGNVHFVVINTNDISVRNILNSGQETWLKENLSTTEKAYKVVIMSRSIYSMGVHNSDNETIGVRRQLHTIFANNNVSLVLQGNDRAYSESYYLDAAGNKIENLKPTDGVHKLGVGTLYVSLGTIGSRYAEYLYDSTVPIAYILNESLNSMKSPTFGRLSYDGENLYYAGYKYDKSAEKPIILRIHKEPITDDWENGILIVFLAIIPAIVILMIIALLAKKTNFFLYRLRPKRNKSKEEEVLKNQNENENDDSKSNADGNLV